MPRLYEPFATASSIECLVHENHQRKEDFEEGDIVDRIYEYSYYELKEIPISDLELDEFDLDDDTVDEYVEKGDDVAPIVFGPIEGSIIDGNHRANAANNRGKKMILGYVGHRGPLPECLLPPANQFENSKKVFGIVSSNQ